MDNIINIIFLFIYISMESYYALLLLLIAVLVIFYINKKEYTFLEKFETRDGDQTDLYDKQYVTIHSIVYKNDDDRKLEVSAIEDLILKKVKNKKMINILDAGSGVGDYTKVFKDKGYQITGIDRSYNMLKTAQYNAHRCKFIKGKLEDESSFKNDEFSHIFCNSSTLYMNNHENIKKILENFHLWTKTNGFLILHVKDPDNLVPIVKNYSQYYYDDYKNKHIFTYFNGFLHNAWYMKNESEKDSYKYYEKITLENGKSRVKITRLTIPPKNEIFDLLNVIGYKLYKFVEVKQSIKGDELVIFRKVKIDKKKYILKLKDENR